MAYKFQIGDARLGGNLVQEGSMSGSTTLGIQAATVTSLNAQGGGITNAGAIAGATTVAMNGALSGVSTIAASGLATIGSLKLFALFAVSQCWNRWGNIPTDKGTSR